ncbi:anti-sigma factor [Naasia lichenicola]|uniref:Regulator of SigK n=1 Tax=Naasia lichenicola TaxID=2565933 RepID=A0A4S4FIC1_9MICO|nr:anti-sigma factor [Naasia lichenicola]THG29808.1 hypothetical protein E6C64_14195 [Naasia lichenicola]
MTRDEFDAANSTGAYALGALSAEDRLLFEDELAGSEELRAEVAGLVDTAAVLAMATPPIDPPPALKSNIMAMLDSTPQLPAQPAEDVLQSIDAARFSSSAPTAADATISSFADHQPTRRSGRGARRSRIRPLTALLASAAAVALFVGGAFAGGLLGTIGSERQSDQFAALNAASDVTREVTPLQSGGTATLVSSDELGASAIVLNDAGDLTDDEVYQLWYLHDQKVTSAGIVDPDGPQTYAVLDGAFDPDYAVAMTVEPAGGSEQPTGIPVLLSGA